jgi:hypothetical protein
VLSLCLGLEIENPYSFLLQNLSGTMISVGIAATLQARQWRTRGLVPVGARGYSFLQCVKTGSGAHTASYPMVPRALSPGLRRPGLEVEHSLLSNAKVNNGGAIPPLIHTSSWHEV